MQGTWWIKNMFWVPVIKIPNIFPQLLELRQRDFPAGLVAKTPHSQCREPGFQPRSGNQTPPAITTKIPHAQLRPGAAETDTYLKKEKELKQRWGNKINFHYQLGWGEGKEQHSAFQYWVFVFYLKICREAAFYIQNNSKCLTPLRYSTISQPETV